MTTQGPRGRGGGPRRAASRGHLRVRLGTIDIPAAAVRALRAYWGLARQPTAEEVRQFILEHGLLALDTVQMDYQVSQGRR